MFNYKLAEVAHELDMVNLNELTPIDALNTLVRIKEKMVWFLMGDGSFCENVPLGPVLFGTFCKKNYPKLEKVA